MDSLFTEIMKTVGAQTIIDMLKKAWGQCRSYGSVNRNVEVLRSKMEELSSQNEDVMLELQREEVYQGKKRKREVELWLENVKKAKDDVQSIENDIENRSWMSLSRYRSVMLVERKIENIVELQKKGEFPNGLVVDPMTEIGLDLPTSSLIGQTTAHKTLETIWNCLMDVKIGKIGVHGMGGIGKTTIMKHINNRLKRDPHFDNVIWVTVSKALNLERLQNDIAKAIKLRFSEDQDEDELRRSTAICAALMRRKKFLLILDDMWEAFPLERIGIPQPSQSNGYKVVFTTRDLGVCQRMESNVNIKVEVLLDEEAWDLFKDKVGNDVVLSSSVQNIAKLVVKECGGLPIAIITIGRALRGVVNPKVWENALHELKSSSTEIKGVEDDVFGCLKFSYNRLRNERIQACFLYCALYPEDHLISTEQLVEQWIGEGFVDEMQTREEMINKGQAILTELIDTCMLETADYYLVERVKMHDLIRDLAISITKVNPRFMVKAGIKLKEAPKDDEWNEDVERVSLCYNDIKALSGQPKCPKLSTLLLHCNPKLWSIENSFFSQMRGLKVVDLSKTSINILPTSVSELENLHTLLLGACSKLKTMPTLQKLKKLRVLNLSGTGIDELPPGMEQLVKLRYLDLSNTLDLHIFQVGIIPKLSTLEYFSMYGSSCKWSWNKDDSAKEGNKIDEFINLTRLEHLKLVFTDSLTFFEFVQSRKCQELKSFHFVIKTSWITYATSPLKYFVEVSDDRFISEGSPLLLPNNTLRVDFIECHGIIRLSEKSLDLSNVAELKECLLYSCDSVECILMAEENTLLPTLEKLILLNLPQLGALCKGVMPFGALACLKVIDIDDCHKLKYIFRLQLLLDLQHLEEIKVKSCKGIEKIIAGNAGEEEVSEANYNDNSNIMLPNLKQLTLVDLPQMKSICEGVLICDFLHMVDVSRCPQLKKIPFLINNPSSTLEGQIILKNLASLEWDDPNSKELLQALLQEDHRKY